MKVFVSLKDDAQQGWVWLQEPSLPARSIVKLTDDVSGKSIYCEALQIDKNFLRQYNQSPRRTIDRPAQSIVINAWHRAMLGGIEPHADASLKVKAANSLFGRFRACTHHPQAIVRVAAWLALVSVGLGVLGALLGVASLCAATLQ